MNEPCLHEQIHGSSMAVVRVGAVSYTHLDVYKRQELDAGARLYRQFGKEEAAKRLLDKREALIGAIQQECWDKRDHFFYSVDVDIKTRKYDWFHQGLGVFWKTLPIKVRVWSGFIPMLSLIHI